MIPIPYANTPWHDLTADQKRMRREGMAREAQRLIEARGAVQRPSNPVQINQIHDPRDTKSGPTAQQRYDDSLAQQLIARMNERDERYA